MKILIVTPFPPCSGTSGGAAAVFNLLKNLAKRHEIICLTFARAEDLPHIPVLAPYCTEVITVPFPGGMGVPLLSRLVHLVRRVRQNLLSLLTLTPVAVWKCKRLPMEKALAESIERCCPDVVHICFPQMAHYVDLCRGCPTVMDTQDVATVSAYRRALKAPNLVARAYHFLQWLFWIRHETRYYPRFGKVLTLTLQDAAALRVYRPELDIYPGAIGIDMPERVSENQVEGSLIGFLANFAHPPNIDAASYFIRDIFPLIQAETPAAEFVVAGKNPPSALKSLAGPGVHFVGFVDDVNQFYAGIDVVVAPLRFGGGIKIKVLEALACGRPVVTTSVGAEGIAGQEERVLWIANDPRQFADGVCQLLSSPDLARELGERGHDLIEQKFSWQRVIEDLGGIYATLAHAEEEVSWRQR